LLSIAYYLFFLALGIDAANRLWSGKGVVYRVWLGAVFGTLLHIWFPALWAFVFGFTVAAHIAAAVTGFVLWGTVFLLRRRVERAPFDKEQCRDLWTLLGWGAPLLLLLAVLFHNHVLLPKAGGLYGGQSTFGDLSMHMGMITSIAWQGVWPPEYSIYPGQLLCYPFLADSQSASFLLLGLPLRWAIIVPSIALAALCIMGVWLFVYDYTGKRGVAALAGLLFFLNGGLGFVLMLNGAVEAQSVFKQIFTAFYQTPTNNGSLSIHWTNVICDMLIPQRTFLLGFAMLPAALYLVYHGCARGERAHLIAGAVLSGALPMMHTHTFLALGVICAGWLIGYLSVQEDRKQYLLRWLKFLGIVVLLALPQLLFWTFRQAVGENFVRFHKDWLNTADPWLWYWVKNVGVVFVLIFPALWAAGAERRRWYLGALMLFILSELVVFQPNVYDNNKLFLVWHLFSSVIVAEYLGNIWRKLYAFRGRYIMAGMMAVVLFASAGLSIAREMLSGGEYLLYDNDAINAASYIREKAPPDALFATGDEHLNPVSALAGRNVYVGSAAYLYFHGIEYGSRQEEICRIYTDREAAQMLPWELGIDYIYVSNYERGQFDLPEDWFASLYPLAYMNDSIEIYAVSERAREAMGG